MLRRSAFARVAYHPVRYSNGRPRAPRVIIGPFVKRWPWIKIFFFGSLGYYFGKKQYKEWSYVPPETQFIRAVNVVPYGALGTSLSMTGTQRNIVQPPDEDTVVVDPTALEYLMTTADDATSTSGAIYHWAGIKGMFPPEVREGVFKAGDAKRYNYDGKWIVHVVAPDFRVGDWTEREASIELSRAYRNLLHEFVMTGKKRLRIPPLSYGMNAGDLYNQIPPLTQEALMSGFEQLHPFDKEHVLESEVELCIYFEREWDKFSTVFTHVTPPSKLH